MKYFVIFVVCAFVVRFAQALKCRTESGPKEEQIAEIMKRCIQNGDSYNEHDDAAGNGKQNEDNSYESSRQYRSPTAALRRNRRQGSNGNNASKNQYNTSLGSQGKQNSSQYEQLQNDNATFNFSSDAAGACMVQCVLQEMKMTGENGLPDRNMMKNVMTNKVKETDLKDFLQESIEECFQLLETDNSNREKCSFSKNLMSCMSERGKSQCDDWQDTQNMRF